MENLENHQGILSNIGKIVTNMVWLGITYYIAGIYMEWMLLMKVIITITFCCDNL